MQLLSLTYCLFAVAVLLLYFGRSCTGQNVLLVVASLVFCATWDIRGALLLFLTTALDFAISRRLEWERPEASRRRAMWLSVVLNIGVLVSIKYGRVWAIEGAPQPVDTTVSSLRHFAPVGLSSPSSV